MIIHKLVWRHVWHGDDDVFYGIQAWGVLRWLGECGYFLPPSTSVLDLGCGSGILGREFVRHGCKVVFSDKHESLRDGLRHLPFRRFTIGEGDYGALGQYDLVLCSNVYEHLADPGEFLANVGRLLKPGGVLFLSWTNWLSPWGGHDFSPFHYLGPKWGPKVYDWLRPGKRQHFPYAGLYPTHIGQTLRAIRKLPGMRVVRVAPRYYTEFSWLMKIPVLREFLAWNCAVLVQKER